MALGPEQWAAALEAARADWLSRARALAAEIYATTGAPVSVDDVRARLPLPDGVDTRVMGVVFRKGDWVLVDYVKSNRKESHHRPVARFARKGT